MNLTTRQRHIVKRALWAFHLDVESNPDITDIDEKEVREVAELFEKVKCHDCSQLVEDVVYTPVLNLPLCGECQKVHNLHEYDDQVAFERLGEQQ